MATPCSAFVSDILVPGSPSTFACAAPLQALEQAQTDKQEAESDLKTAKATLADLESTLEARQQKLAAERERKRRPLLLWYLRRWCKC